MEAAATEKTKTKRVLSGIQPSGALTLGNYLGALKNWVKLQDYQGENNNECLYMIADLHAITVRQDPKELRQRSLETYALLMAVGLDEKKNIMFIQSQVPSHSELAWVLNCYTQFGELSRMTQFKDKSQNHPENINAGLFTYPCLMASDILLYQSDYVPVGQDQKQHLELARDVAVRFNGIHGDTFTVPEPYIGELGARVMSLQNPAKKMSKSDPDNNAWISLLDSSADIVRKIKRAVTDSENEVCAREGKDGIINLMGIYSCITKKSMDVIQNEFSGAGYGAFKSALAQAVDSELCPIREKFDLLMKNKDYLENCYTEGAKQAAYIAEKTMDKVFKKVGLVKRIRRV